jgi:hypothetical protein
MFKSILFFAKVGVLATALLLMTARPSQAQRRHVSFRQGTANAHAGVGPGRTNVHRHAGAFRGTTARTNRGIMNSHRNAFHLNTPHMNMPQMITPHMNMPHMNTPDLRGRSH